MVNSLRTEQDRRTPRIVRKSASLSRLHKIALREVELNQQQRQREKGKR
jgi:hypothetical protein